jgi:hypothetical protein
MPAEKEQYDPDKKITKIRCLPNVRCDKQDDQAKTNQQEKCANP